MILSKAILQLYPNAIEHEDFIIMAEPDSEPYIAHWNGDKFPKPTQEQLESAWIAAESSINKQNEVADLIAYLNETDWYFVRSLDSGKAIPSDVKQKRTAARMRLQELGL